MVPITVAVRSKEWTVFAPSTTGVVGSNSILDMDVCVCLFRLFCVCAVQGTGNGLMTGSYPVQGVLPIV
jgi:hypothetical protein